MNQSKTFELGSSSVAGTASTPTKAGHKISILIIFNQEFTTLAHISRAHQGGINNDRSVEIEQFAEKALALFLLLVTMLRISVRLVRMPESLRLV
jgi:hypothetical protein